MAQRTDTGQMTLAIATGQDEEIVRGTIGISGRLPTDYELDLDEELTVQIASADGEVIAAGKATVAGVKAIANRGEGIPWTERRQTAKLNPEQD